ncbi:hypothetical protein B484DRAFT_447219 [Ochromonadaceae sp. CCMP2298]|nr:hypothetical protein B484DRAFT_457004 [Ochromonadaceae sp. CCMP2298]KAJ1420809.1 hypothetical protein B484DRAFT_452945 [Ochromonadaceae sp. CCMP2298]KAJ1433602.1 hypothetical protein B484DRAFT_447219 [Ochromonadaceae sp. CCMP2298]
MIGWRGASKSPPAAGFWEGTYQPAAEATDACNPTAAASDGREDAREEPQPGR